MSFFHKKNNPEVVYAKHLYCLGLYLGAGEGNRTPVISLEGWNSTIELHPHW